MATEKLLHRLRCVPEFPARITVYLAVNPLFSYELHAGFINGHLGNVLTLRYIEHGESSFI
jgi:hypothetical protein